MSTVLCRRRQEHGRHRLFYGKTIYDDETEQSVCPHAKYTGVEYASGFVDDMDDRLTQITDEELGICRFMNQDIRDFTFEDCTLITSLFTLQFMPPSCRKDVLKRIYNGLDQNGAFIFAEKTVSRDARIQEIMTFQFYDHKRKHFNGNDILEKEVELRHMLKPNTWRELHNLLMTAGFDLQKFEPIPTEPLISSIRDCDQVMSAENPRFQEGAINDPKVRFFDDYRIRNEFLLEYSQYYPHSGWWVLGR